MAKNRVGGTIHKFKDNDGVKKIEVNAEAPDTNLWNCFYGLQRFNPVDNFHGGDLVETNKEFKLEKFTITIIRTKLEDQSEKSSGKETQVMEEDCKFLEPQKSFAQFIRENYMNYRPEFIEMAKKFALEHFKKALEFVAKSISKSGSQSQKENPEIAEMGRMIKKIVEEQKEVKECMSQLLKNKESKLVTFEWLFLFILKIIFKNIRKYEGEQVFIMGSWDDWNKKIKLPKNKLIFFMINQLLKIKKETFFQWIIDWKLGIMNTIMWLMGRSK